MSCCNCPRKVGGGDVDKSCPYLLNLLDKSILNISTELGQIALIIILTRAGLNLDLKDLKQVGRPAILMCFLPACFEIFATIIFAPRFLGLTLLESAILGTVIAAVSPAVVVPKMLYLMEQGYGTNKSIPQMIMAGASVDWVAAEVWLFVLVGATVNISYAFNAGLMTIILLAYVILFRMLGIIISLFNTNLNPKERIFTAISYMPKATVQAAIGGLPLAMGLSNGDTILTVAVLSILITAPIGAGLIDFTHKRLLFKESQ